MMMRSTTRVCTQAATAVSLVGIGSGSRDMNAFSNSVLGHRWLIIVFVVTVVGFRHLDPGLFPNQAAPFIGFTHDLQGRLGARRVSLNAQDFGDHGQGFPVVTEDPQAHASTDWRQLALQIDQGAVGSDVLGFTLGHYLRALVRVPFGTNWKSMYIAWSGSVFNNPILGHQVFSSCETGLEVTGRMIQGKK